MVDRRKLRTARNRLKLARNNFTQTKEQIEAQGDLFNIQNKNTKEASKRLTIAQKEADLLRSSYQQRQQQIANINNQLQNSNNLTRSKVQELQNERAALVAVNQLGEEEIGILQEQNRELQRKIILYSEMLKAQKKALEEVAKSSKKILKDITGINAQANEGVKEFLSGSDKLFKNFTGVNDLFSNMFQSVTGGQGLFQGLFTGINDGINQVGGLVAKFTLDVKEEIESTDAAMAKFTGSSRELKAEMNSLKHAGSGLLLNYEESQRAIENLYRSSFAYRDSTKKQRREMGLLGATFDRLGISLEGIGGAQDNLIKVLDMTSQESIKTTKEIFGLGKALKIPPQIMMNDFINALGPLTKYGSDSIRVFRNMAATSAATGVEISNLLNITDRFDTFEGAAAAAANLNNVLGGPYLDTMRLLNATQDEKIQLLRQSFSESGKDFEQMSRFEKQFVAQTIGAQDVAEAKKLLYGEEAKLQEALGESANKTDKQQEAMKNMASAAQNTLTATEQLNRSIKGMLGLDAKARELIKFQGQLTKIFKQGYQFFERYPGIAKLLVGIKLGSWFFMAAKNALGLNDVFEGGLISSTFKLIGLLYKLYLGYKLIKAGMKELDKYKDGEDNIFSTTAGYIRDAIYYIDELKVEYEYLKEVFGISMKFMSDTWNSFTGMLSASVAWVKENVWFPIKGDIIFVIVKVRQAADSISDGIKNIFDSLKTFFKKAIDPIKPAFNKIKNKLFEFGSSIKAFFDRSVIQPFKKLKPILEPVNKFLSGMVDKVKEFFSLGGEEEGKGFFKKAFEFVIGQDTAEALREADLNRASKKQNIGRKKATEDRYVGLLEDITNTKETEIPYQAYLELSKAINESPLDETSFQMEDRNKLRQHFSNELKRLGKIGNVTGGLTAVRQAQDLAIVTEELKSAFTMDVGKLGSGLGDSISGAIFGEGGGINKFKDSVSDALKEAGFTENTFNDMNKSLKSIKHGLKFPNELIIKNLDGQEIIKAIDKVGQGLPG